MFGTRVYSTWAGMMQRCKPTYKRACDYYDRGIRVCLEWRNSFETFYEWAMENGYSDNLQIDRRDNNQGYYPWNCRFVTAQVNASNTRRNHFLTINNQTKTLQEWANEIGINAHTLRLRMRRGWKEEELLKPVIACYRNKRTKGVIFNDLCK
jgi:hypothetical protein